MHQSRAKVELEAAGRYITRLCKHWGHRYQASCDEHQGHIDFGSGTSCSLNADGSALTVLVTAPEDTLDKLEAVFVEHLQRFIPKGEHAPHFEWQRFPAPNQTPDTDK